MHVHTASITRPHPWRNLLSSPSHSASSQVAIPGIHNYLWVGPFVGGVLGAIVKEEPETT